MSRDKTEGMPNTKSTPFQLHPTSQAEALAGPPRATNLAGGSSWKSAHESALLGLALLLASRSSEQQPQAEER